MHARNQALYALCMYLRALHTQTCDVSHSCATHTACTQNMLMNVHRTAQSITQRTAQSITFTVPLQYTGDTKDR